MKLLNKLLFVFSLLMINVSLVMSEEFFETRNVATKLDTPWEILWGPDNYIWMTERYGRVSRVNPETGELFELVTINEVFENGERGLMGMALHPQFSESPYVYVVYNTGSTDANTRIKIVRYTYENNKLSNPSIIIDNIKGWWNHNGARLWIDEDLKLWFTIGDAASSGLAQDLSNVNGKLCRINLDGTIPADNPFPNSAIWSFGHRNQQGLVFANGKIYTSEHGASTDDEVNLILKGRNYGWPQVQGYCDNDNEKKVCAEKNVVEPIKSLYPEYTLALGGIDYYNHSAMKQLQNSLLVVSLKAGKLTQLKLDENGEKVLETNDIIDNKYGRLRDLCISPDGRIFISTSNKDGRGGPAVEDDRIIELKAIESSINNSENSNINIYPNPVDEMMNFETDEDVLEIQILNIHGDIVRNIVPNLRLINWDRTDNIGNRLSSGIYFIKFISKSNTEIRKIILK